MKRSVDFDFVITEEVEFAFLVYLSSLQSLL